MLATVALVLVASAATAASSATPIGAVDPLASARAAFRAGKYDEAKNLASAAKANGLAGAAMHALHDDKSACALYAADLATKADVGAALRVIDCDDAAGDAAHAIATAKAHVVTSPLFADPAVFARVAQIAKKANADDVLSAVKAQVDAQKPPLFDSVRRDAFAQTLALLGGDASMARLLVELPDTAAAKSAIASGAKAPAPKDLREALARANVLADRQQNDDVVALLSPMIGAKDFGEPACDARLLLGKTYRKLHKLQTAKKTLDVVATKCGDETKKRAAYLGARVAWLSKNAQATSMLQAFVDAWPKDSLTDDVLLWLGEAHAQNGDAKKSDAAWKKIVDEFSDGDMIHEARFHLAWSRAQQGDVAGARSILDEAARNAGTHVDVADRALYWRARLALYPKLDALSATTDAKLADEGKAELVALANARPASWYGLLARLDVNALGTKETPLVSPKNVRDAAATSSLTPTDALANDARFTLARTLVDAGYDDEALLALGALDLQKLAAQDRFVVALLEGRAGDAGHGHALLRDAGLALLPGTPSTENALAWSLDWPRAHEPAIVAAADENKVPSALLFGIAREESAFDADIVSWAGAVGLCQLMPPTAADEAKSKGLDAPSVDGLKDPVLNARLGASHIGRRLRGLRHPALAIAAYNAGPAAVAQWSPKGPVDAWVESIPVDETRNYVKKVTGSWVTYALLDGSVDDVTFSLVLP